MSAASASAVIGASTPPTGSGPAAAPLGLSTSRPAQRKRAVPIKAVVESVPESGLLTAAHGRTTRRNRDVATTSLNGEDSADFVYTRDEGHAQDLSHTLHGEHQLPQKQKGKASPTGRPKMVKQSLHKEVQVLRKRPNSIWDVTGHLFSRFFILLILGLGLGTSLYNWRTQTIPAPNKFSAEVAKLEEFVTKTTAWIQVQLELVDMKIGQEVGELKKELTSKIESQETAVETEIRNVKDSLEKVSSSLDSLFGSGGPLTRKETLELMKAVVDTRAVEGAGQALSLDDVRAVARKIVMQELDIYAADGIGKADYALGSAGGRVVAHSESYYAGRNGDWRQFFNVIPGSNRLHPRASKILEPSFGEPGQCLPLKGSNGFVEIALRTNIHPESITLEHISKMVAFDVTSAPKDFHVFGWFEPRLPKEKAVSSAPVVQKLLGEFRYELGLANIQTFKFSEGDIAGTLVNVIKLQILSNYGSPSHTCIYRIRAHGTEPETMRVPSPALASSIA